MLTSENSNGITFLKDSITGTATNYHQTPIPNHFTQTPSYLSGSVTTYSSTKEGNKEKAFNMLIAVTMATQIDLASVKTMIKAAKLIETYLDGH